MTDSKPYVLDLSEVSADDVSLVGGKCSGLGELFRELTAQGVRSVDGFTTTSHAYEVLLTTNGLRKRLQRLLKGMDVTDLNDAAPVGREARAVMLETRFPPEVETAISAAYESLGKGIGK